MVAMVAMVMEVLVVVVVILIGRGDVKMGRGAVGRVGQDRSKVVAAAVSRGRRRIPEQWPEAGGGSAGRCGGAGADEGQGRNDQG